MATPYFTGWRLILLTIGLGLGTFIQILDTSVANVAIPYIAGDLAVSPDDGTWVITSFSISNGLVLALTGWLSNRFGSIKLFVWSTALFSVTSWLCGLANSLATLVLFRILQGAAGGTLIPLSQALLISHYPEDKKGIALGSWSMIVIVAPIMGPVIGGYLTDFYGWRWIFYINIPIGFFSAWLSWVMLKDEIQQTNRKTPLDIMGFLLLTMGISCLQVFCDKGNDLDWFNSLFIRTMLTTSIIAFILFIIWNLYSEYPVMNFDYFKHLNFSLGTLLCAISYILFFGTTVLLPLWLETQVGYTAYWAGVAVMPMGILYLFFIPFVGRAIARVDSRQLVAISFIVSAITFFWFSYLTPDVSLQHIMLIRLLQGAGLAFYFAPILAIALSPIATSELPGASGVVNFIRLVSGGGIGTSTYVTLWDHRAIFHHSRLIENVTPYNPLNTQFYEAILELLPITRASANQLVENIILQQAYLLAVNDMFWMTAWIYLILIPFLWLCHPIQQMPIRKTLVSD